MSKNNVEDILKRIFHLQKELTEKQSELEKLQAMLRIVDGTDMPNAAPEGFDIKKAIVEYFDSAKGPRNVDDVVRHITNTYKFIVDRRTVAVRINYLADRLHVLARSDQRGFYIKQ